MRKLGARYFWPLAVLTIGLAAGCATSPPTPGAEDGSAVLSVDDSTACVAKGADLVCWTYEVSFRDDRPDLLEGPVVARFTVPGAKRVRQLVGTYRTGCVIDELDRLGCWSQPRPQQTALPVEWLPGAYRDVARINDHVCAVRESGQVDCFSVLDDAAAQAAANAPDLRLIAIDAALSFCGVTAEGALGCWRNLVHPRTFSAVERLTNDLTDVAMSDRVICGRGTGGELSCIGDGSDESHYEGRYDYDQSLAPPGPFDDAAVGPYHGCGLRPDGTVVCWGLGSRAGIIEDRFDWDQAVPPAGCFRSIAVGNALSCGLRCEGGVACWGRGGTPPEARGGATGPNLVPVPRGLEAMERGRANP